MSSWVSEGQKSIFWDFCPSENRGRDQENCLKGEAPPCTMQAGAPFCTRPCLMNATLNFGIVEESWAIGHRSEWKGQFGARGVRIPCQTGKLRASETFPTTCKWMQQAEFFRRTFLHTDSVSSILHSEVQSFSQFRMGFSKT